MRRDWPVNGSPAWIRTMVHSFRHYTSEPEERAASGQFDSILTPCSLETTTGSVHLTSIFPT